MRHYELSRKQWAQVEPLFPKNGESGSQWRDHFLVVNGILWALRTGAPCLPSKESLECAHRLGGKLFSEEGRLPHGLPPRLPEGVERRFDAGDQVVRT